MEKLKVCFSKAVIAHLITQIQIEKNLTFESMYQDYFEKINM